MSSAAMVSVNPPQYEAMNFLTLLIVDDERAVRDACREAAAAGVLAIRSFRYEESCLLDFRRGPHLRGRRDCIRNRRRRTNARFGWRGCLAQFCSVEQ